MFMTARCNGPLSWTGVRIEEEIFRASTETAFEVTLASTEENGAQGDSGVVLNPPPSS